MSAVTMCAISVFLKDYAVVGQVANSEPNVAKHPPVAHKAQLVGQPAYQWLAAISSTTILSTILTFVTAPSNHVVDEANKAILPDFAFKRATITVALWRPFFA
jgi:hypothetical protein